MTRQLLIACFLLNTAIINSQNIADFEDFALPVDTFLNGKDGAGGFCSGNIFLPNDYDQSFASWIGWSVSSATDTTTPGFTNQYSAIPGSGFQGSNTYAVSFSPTPNIIHLKDEAQGNIVSGFYVTNATYPYMSMLHGDAFAKKFGSASGSDPDFFLLTVKKYQNGFLGPDSVNFYLADFRSDDSEEDYIVDGWQFVDLTPLGPADSLWLSLSSSDVGQFGMNTPAYFCVDQIMTGGVSTTAENPAKESLIVFPNPCAEYISVQTQAASLLFKIFTIDGTLQMQGKCSINTNEIDVSHLPRGIYLLSGWLGGDKLNTIVVKQ